MSAGEEGEAVPSAPASPCISVCRIDQRRGLCEGCLRTLDEIAGWGRYSDQEKRAVLARLAVRRAGATGGASDEVADDGAGDTRNGAA